MNAGGVLGSMCFPSFPGFSGRLFAAADDKDLALAVLQAYNDWHVDEWCGAYPGRFIPMGLPVLWDAELAAAEVRRLAAKGVHSLTFTENPATLGYPSFHDPSWDPLWTGAVRRGRGAVDPPGLVGPAGRHRARRADRRDDHAAAHEHLRGGGRPAVVAGDQGVPRHPHRPVRGRHRLDPLLPRPPRPHLRHAPPVDRPGLRRPDPERGVPRALPHLLHRRSDRHQAARRHRHRQHRLGVRLPALGLVVARGARGAGRGGRRRARRRAGQDHHENAMRWYSFDPFARAAAGAVDGRARCGPRPPATTWPPARSTRAASTAATRAPTSASWPRPPPPSGPRRTVRAGAPARAAATTQSAARSARRRRRRRSARARSGARRSAAWS